MNSQSSLSNLNLKVRAPSTPSPYILYHYLLNNLFWWSPSDHEFLCIQFHATNEP